VDDVLVVTRGRFPAGSPGSRHDMGITDKISGRIKQAAGDLTDDASMRQQGRKEERKGEAKEQQARAEERADAKRDEVRDLDRQT
jgi:uncharacterized protein YjbJ (UPF0337 family)